MKKLVIAEKPSVGGDYMNILAPKAKRMDGFYESDEYIITWCIGHLVTMSYPEVYGEEYKKWKLDTLPFLPNEYKYEIIDSVKKQYNVVKKAINRKDIDTIYYAGDSGREGVYIQMLVRSMAGHKQGVSEKVVWIDSHTEAEIRRGFATAKDISNYLPLADAGYERAIEDYSMGINFSRALSLKYGNTINQILGITDYKDRKAIAIGRVMTCVLGMIVDKEREIRSFKETPFYKITCTATDTNGVTYDAEWKAIEGSIYYGTPALYSEKGFKNRKDAEDAISKLALIGTTTIEKVDKSVKKKNAPLLFNLAELQNECSKEYKISPDETLAVVQTLYEKKLTTYPRTDAKVLSSAVAKEIGKNLSGLKKYSASKEFAEEILTNGWDKNIIKTKYTDDSKITDHYAIIPTGQGFENLNSLKQVEKDIYELICKRFLSIFYPASETYEISVVQKTDTESFFSKASTLKSAGYLKVVGYEIKEKEREKAKLLVSLKSGTVLQVSFSVAEGKTTPPKRYTSGSIILTMENAGQLIEDASLREQIKGSGIGTSSTRAEILKKLVKNEYISMNKKTQVLTPALLGELIYEVVSLSIPNMLSPKMTASWEKGLDGVAKGTVTRKEYQDKLEAYVSNQIKKIKDVDLSTQLKTRCSQVVNIYK